MSTVGYKGDGAPVAAAAAPSPPIVELAKFLGHVLNRSYALISRTTIGVLLSLLAPISFLYSPVAYLLAPVFVLTRVLLDVFVFTPYAIVVSVAHNLYPIYVFVGSAVLCAIVLGFFARAVSTGIVRAIFAPRKPRQDVEMEEDVPGSATEPREKSAMKPAGPKTRVRKRVSIKEDKER
ncbi:hypothetical protein C8Q76DRAFT_740526 [Earliella scabrosa]|nr:hypothetical protein C8Q76DRAFT_740526 [Earliella scabrosa]